MSGIVWAFVGVVGGGGWLVILWKSEVDKLQIY